MIKTFRDENRFLSNFYPALVTFEGKEYRSVEHAYVAAKTTSESLRFEIQSCPTSGQVKAFGRTLQVRPDWDRIKLGVMKDLVTQKFQHPDLLEMLMDTYPQYIVEGNVWHDNFWGSCMCNNCGDKGKNNLGKILMHIREKATQLTLPL